MSDEREIEETALADWVSNHLQAGNSPGKIAMYLEQIRPGFGIDLMPWIRGIASSGSNPPTADPLAPQSFAMPETKNGWPMPDALTRPTPTMTPQRPLFAPENEPPGKMVAFTNSFRPGQSGLLTSVADRRTGRSAAQGLLSAERSLGTRLPGGGVSVDIDPKVRLPDGSYYTVEDNGGITVPLDPLPERQTTKTQVAANPSAQSTTIQSRSQPRSVISTVEGVVGAVGWQNPKNKLGGMGWRIYINRPDGSRIGFGHMDPSSTLKPGTKVKPGDVIGLYANPTNGHSSRPHVHVQMFDNRGRIVDPGTTVPLARGGVISSKYEERGPMHKRYPHQGIDWVERTK